MGLYDGIQVPVSGQPASASLYGIAVRNAIIDIDARLSIVEQLTAQLPAPVKIFGNGTNTLVGTINTWTNLPTTTFTVNMTNPSAVFDMWCEVKIGAWLSAPTGPGSTRMSVAVSGGVTAIEDPNPTSVVGYGLLPMETSNDANPRQHAGGFSIKIPAGSATVVFTPRGMRTTTTGTAALNYPTMEVTPIRFTLP
jgi:hypothetical protein